VGTETLLKYADKYEVPKFVLLSSGDVYGPNPTSSHFIDEDSPLMASQRFPEIRTLVAVDRTVQKFFWQHKKDIETVILRPAHIVGPNVRNAPSKYLRLGVMPTMMGFDPLVQLISENDVTSYLVQSLEKGVQGIFNIASTEPVPLSKILEILGKPVLPVPHRLFRAIMEKAWKYQLTSFPAPELDHIRFNKLLETSRSTEQFGSVNAASLYDMLEPFTAENPRRD
jgi:UDP-glucose 4-epimerase